MRPGTPTPANSSPPPRMAARSRHRPPPPRPGWRGTVRARPMSPAAAGGGPSAAPAPAATAGGSVLEVPHLRKTYVAGGGWWRPKRVVAAVDDVSFSVRRGETLGIVGESGSGKSTIAKCLLRLTGIDGGEIHFNGCDLATLSERQFRPLRKHVQMIFQDPFASLNPRHTVGRIICDGPVANGVPMAEAQRRARELLELVGLDASAFARYPQQFSG